MGLLRLSSVLLPVLLMACVPEAILPPVEPMPPVSAPGQDAGADTCGASAMQDLVGKPFSALAAMTFPETTRLIRPGMAVTMDFLAERLNITLDETGAIASVTCG
jgi:hypothetical protein